jgi:ABC-type cobalt transport system substrate-binding protein
MKAELMALTLLVISFGIIVAQTAPWEHANGKTLQGLSDLPGSSYTPWAASSWQPSLEERILLFGLGAIISCAMLACIRHYKKRKEEQRF